MTLASELGDCFPVNCKSHSLCCCLCNSPSGLPEKVKQEVYEQLLENVAANWGPDERADELGQHWHDIFGGDGLLLLRDDSGSIVAHSSYAILSFQGSVVVYLHGVMVHPKCQGWGVFETIVRFIVSQTNCKFIVARTQNVCVLRGIIKGIQSHCNFCFSISLLLSIFHSYLPLSLSIAVCNSQVYPVPLKPTETISKLADFLVSIINLSGSLNRTTLIMPDIYPPFLVRSSPVPNQGDPVGQLLSDIVKPLPGSKDGVLVIGECQSDSLQ